MRDLVAIVGPTAAGKTAVGLRLAGSLGGEIVNADSRLFYRGFDTGTAKPTPAERSRVPHHLLDILGPSETLGLAAFMDTAAAAIGKITARGRLPIVVGGTGQYVWGLLEGWRVPRVPPDPALRARLERDAQEQGSRALHDRLAALDRAAADRIDHRNVRRVIRALEVAMAESPGDPPPPDEPSYCALIIGLTTDRAELYRRVDERIDAMIEAGWAEEVRRHLDAGIDAGAPAMAAIGYRELAEYLRRERSMVEAVQAIRRRTRRLIRQQYNWFKLDDPRIQWIEADQQAALGALAAVREWLAVVEDGST